MVGDVAGDIGRPQWSHAYDRDTHIQPHPAMLRLAETQTAQGGRPTATIVPGERLVLTVAEAGELLGISRAFAYELVARGELPVIRLGRRIVVPKAALWPWSASPPRPTEPELRNDHAVHRQDGRRRRGLLPGHRGPGQRGVLHRDR